MLHVWFIQEKQKGFIQEVLDCQAVGRLPFVLEVRPIAENSMGWSGGWGQGDWLGLCNSLNQGGNEVGKDWIEGM